MRFIQHKACSTDVVVKRVKVVDEEHALIQIWCPACKRVVTENELNREGPYSAYLTAGAGEEEA